jgi:hypothetical protein
MSRQTSMGIVPAMVLCALFRVSRQAYYVALRRVAEATAACGTAVALPGYPRNRAGQALYVDHAAAVLRDALQKAGVDRPKLYQNGNNRLRIRAHDLRATFVTLALANGKSEDWVMQRTGHSSSIMLARYRREAKTAQELGLGWLHPPHEVIPELRNLNVEPGVQEVQSSATLTASLKNRFSVRRLSESFRCSARGGT